LSFVISNDGTKLNILNRDLSIAIIDPSVERSSA